MIDIKNTCGHCKHYIDNEPCAKTGKIVADFDLVGDCNLYQVGWHLCPLCHSRMLRVGKYDYKCNHCHITV